MVLIFQQIIYTLERKDLASYEQKSTVTVISINSLMNISMQTCMLLK